MTLCLLLVPDSHGSQSQQTVDLESAQVVGAPFIYLLQGLYFRQPPLLQGQVRFQQQQSVLKIASKGVFTVPATIDQRAKIGQSLFCRFLIAQPVEAGAFVGEIQAPQGGFLLVNPGKTRFQQGKGGGKISLGSIAVREVRVGDGPAAAARA